MEALFKRFIKEEEGLETVEYAVMTALIIAGVVAAIVALRGAIEGRFGETETVINEAGVEPAAG